MYTAHYHYSLQILSALHALCQYLANRKHKRTLKIIQGKRVDCQIFGKTVPRRRSGHSGAGERPSASSR